MPVTSYHAYRSKKDGPEVDTPSVTGSPAADNGSDSLVRKLAMGDHLSSPGYASSVRQLPGHQVRRTARAALRSAKPATLAERAERAQALDRPVSALSGLVVRALPPGRRTDALHGVPFGQPAHPALVRHPPRLLGFRGPARPARRARRRARLGDPPRGGSRRRRPGCRRRARRLVGAAQSPAARRPGARARPGGRDGAVRRVAARPGGRAARARASCCRPPACSPPRPAPTWAGTSRSGSAPGPATPSRSATSRRSAGTTCARSRNCQRDARSAASSAT